MKIAIIGTGGVGGYFGGKLAQAGLDVTFVARGKHLAAMKEQGLSVKSIQGDFQVDQVKVTDEITSIREPDLIILGVKAWQVKEIRGPLAQIIHEKSMVLPLQNGVLASAELAETINPQNILGGLCRIISQIDAPGVIRHSGVNPSIVLGELHEQSSARTQQLQSLLKRADIEATLSTNIQVDLWKKFIFICTGGLQAIRQMTFGALRTQPDTRNLMIDLLQEIYDLSEKIGIGVSASYVAKTIRFIDDMPEAATFSLARDIWDDRPSEIEYQNGAVVRLGKKHGFPTPVNQLVYDQILNKGPFKAPS